MADPDAVRYLRIAQADLAEARRMVERYLSAKLSACDAV